MAFEFAVLAAFGAMVCWGIGDFLIQRTTRKIGDLESLGFIGLIGAAALLPFVISDLPSLLEPQNLALLGLLGVITFIAAIFDFEALKKGKISVVDIVLELELPITAVLGMIFFFEFPSLGQTAMIAVILAGIVLMAFSRDRRKSAGRIEKGVLLAVVAAVGMGVINFLTAAGARQVSPLMAIWVPWVIFAALSFAIVCRREGAGRMLANSLKYKWLILAMGAFDTMAWLFFALASVGSLVAVTIAITESYPAIAMALGVWLNREKIAHHQWFGAVLAVAASVALGFFL